MDSDVSIEFTLNKKEASALRKIANRELRNEENLVKYMVINLIREQEAYDAADEDRVVKEKV